MVRKTFAPACRGFYARFVHIVQKENMPEPSCKHFDDGFFDIACLTVETDGIESMRGKG